MAAPALDVDWEAIKAHAITHGPREAARAFGVKEGTVLKRCAEGKWLARAGQAVVVQELPKSMQKRKVINVIKPSEAARNSLERLGSKSRLYAAKAVLNGMKAGAKLPGEAVIAAASGLASLGKLAQTARLPEWEAASPSGTMLGISLSVTVGQEQPVVDVEATVRPTE